MRTLRIPTRKMMGVAVMCDQEGFNLKTVMQAIEKSAIIDALDDTIGNRTKAAKLLGINRTTLIMKMKKLNITALNFQEDTTQFEAGP